MSPVPPIRLLLTLVLGLLAGSIVAPQAALAVVAGNFPESVNKAEDGTYPWTVAILERSGSARSQFCGGTLIGRNRVLTAAHCIDPAGENQATADSIDILVGQASLAATGCVPQPAATPPKVCPADSARKVGTRMRVAQISLHAKTDIVQVGSSIDHFYYDVAILTLETDVPSEYWPAIVSPVATAGENLSEAPDQPEAWGPRTTPTNGVRSYVAGWGVLSYGSGAAPNVLRFGGGDRLTRLADDECARRYPGEFRAEDMLCSGLYSTTGVTTTIDACQGDSGGPLLKRAYMEDYVRLSEAEAYDWAGSEAARLTSTALAAAKAQAMSDMPASVLNGWRAERRAEITDAQRDGWRQEIEAALTEQQPELTAEQREPIIAARLAARIDVEVNLLVEPMAVVGTATVYGNLYRQRLADEQARQFASYPREGRHWRLMGVVSWGESCGRPDKPGVYSRVGAPAIRSYVTSANPAPMPYLASVTAGPSVAGTFGLGQTVTCQPGDWVGASDYQYTMWRDVNGDGSRSAGDRTLSTSRPDYRVTTSDITGLRDSDLAKGITIGCIVRARGAGGYATMTGVTTVPVQQPGPIVVPDPPSTPVPGTTPPPTPTDVAGPQLSKRAAVCSATSCRVSIVAVDGGVAATGVKTVSAKLTITRKSSCRAKSGRYKGKMRPCTKTIRKTTTATRSGNQWVAKFTGLRKHDRFKLVFTAKDGAGHTSTLAVPIKLRPATRSA